MAAGTERFLRYWAANMTIAWSMSNGAPWPGFGYTTAERERLAALAEPVPGAAVVLFFVVTTIVFIAFAGAAVVGIFIPGLELLYPDPSKAQPLSFFLLLAVCIALGLGLGFPLAIAMGAWAGDAWGGGKPAHEHLPTDEPLYRKVRWQFIRMALIMAGTFVPFALAWLLFGIDAGPILAIAKFALLGIGTGNATLAARGQKS